VKKYTSIKIFLPFILLISILFFASFLYKSLKEKDLIVNNKHSSNLEELRSLPYATWGSQDVDKAVKGVTKYNKDKASFGYNLYTDDVSNAYLMDMEGDIVHEWKLPDIKGKWEYAVLLDDGSVIAICVSTCIAKVDKNSKVNWITHINAHHDIEVLPDGTYLIPFGRIVEYNSRKVAFDIIGSFSAQGKLFNEWSTLTDFEKIKRFHKPILLDKKSEKPNTKKIFVYYHLNSIKILPKNDLEGQDKRFQEGNWLICLRHVNLILILDKDTKEIVWSYGAGILDWPHMPVMTKEGNILIFDNGKHRGYSKVIEVEPLTKKMVWEYKGDPLEAFYSEFEGSCQRLDNGNTLICESWKGRAFEVTKEGEIVWEFFNPEFKEKKEGTKRKNIYRMIRYSKEEVGDLLDSPEKDVQQ